MCRRLLAATPDLNVLFIGVNAGPELGAAVIRAGAAGVVPHTIDEDELVEAIRTAAAGRMVMSKDALTDALRAEREATTTDPLANLTSLERELFAFVGEGLTNAEIAERMHLSPGTVRNYVSRLLRKLQVQRRAQVVALAARRDVEQAAPWVDRQEFPSAVPGTSSWWWRWRESNPRPSVQYQGFSGCSLLCFSQPRRSRRQAADGLSRC